MRLRDIKRNRKRKMMRSFLWSVGVESNTVFWMYRGKLSKYKYYLVLSKIGSLCSVSINVLEPQGNPLLM